MEEIHTVVRVKKIYSGFQKKLGKKFRFNGESHEFWEMLYVISGKVGVAEEERIYELSGGNAIFYSPMEFHSIWSSDGTSPRIIIISFSLEGEGFDSIGSGVYNIGKADASLIKDAVSFYSSFIKNGQPFYIQLAGIRIEELVLRLTKMQIPKPDYKVTIGTKNYKIIVKFLNDHVFDNLSSEEIAKECGFSLSNLKKTFKKYSGMGIMKYYNEQRMIKAAALIRDEMRMCEIADALNFSSQNYFSQVFKREFKMSPMQYKKMMEKANL